MESTISGEDSGAAICGRMKMGTMPVAVGEVTGGWTTREVAFWKGPAQELRGAARRGELRVAQMRLASVAILCVTPVFHLIDGRLPPEGWIGVLFFSLALALAYLVYRRARLPYVSPALSFVSSALDVSLVTASLAVDAFLVDPYIATNSQFVFMIYLLAIGATALRHDTRVCLVTGALAMTQHAALAAVVAQRYDLGAAGKFSVEYGDFSWHTIIVRSFVLAMQTYLSWAIVRRITSLWHRSVRDLRTGLYNRSFFDEKLAEEIARWRRHKRPFAVAMFDLDRFKRINDDYGHAFGDEILGSIGQCLLDSMRGEDSACRYGGDELVLLLTEIEPTAAIRRVEEIAERIRELSLNPKHGAEPVSITASIGIAFAGQDAQSSRQLLAVADQRLYEAKAAGRDRIEAGVL